jgi:protein-disulfide isomerase
MVSIMNKRLWIVFVVLVLVALSGLILWKKGDKTDMDVGTFDPEKLLTIDDVGEDQIPDHYVGNKDAKIVVIEYEDFACVHCAQLSSAFDKIMSDYKTKVLFIYRNFSLDYPNSIVTQSAGEAAYLLGGEEAFWKMHDLLFQDDSTWTGQAVSTDRRKELLGNFAEEIGLDVDKFLKAVENYRNNGILDKMNRDKNIGKRLDVTGTPAWFINGKKVDELNDGGIRKAIDEALAAVGETINKDIET